MKNDGWKGSVRFEQKWSDLWIGIYWSRTMNRFDVYLCILPTLPIHFAYYLN